MPVHFLDCVYRPASGPIAVGIVLEVSLEDGFDHDLGGSLNHTITNGWNAEWTLATIRFGDHHPPHRIRSVCLRDQFRAQARQPCFQALLLDASKRHPIHTRCTRIDAGEPIGVDQDVLAADLVVEQIEAEGGLRLGFAVELSLKVPDHIRRCQAHHQSPPPHHLQKRTRSRGPLLHRRYPASTLLLPRPTPAVTTAWCDAEAATLVRDGSPPVTTNHPSDVPCPLPRRIAWVRVSIASPHVRPSPNDRRVGIRIRTFEACSGFTLVTAHRIAQQPKAAFVAGLRPSQLPGRAACQLPDQSTIIRVRPSLTDSSRPRGARSMQSVLADQRGFNRVRDLAMTPL